MEKKILIISILALLLTGCTALEPIPTLTNEEIIKEINICKEAGLEYDVLSNISHEAFKIQCK